MTKDHTIETKDGRLEEEGVSSTATTNDDTDNCGHEIPPSSTSAPLSFANSAHPASVEHRVDSSENATSKPDAAAVPSTKWGGRRSFVDVIRESRNTIMKQ
jgi:hypothetical protein